MIFATNPTGSAASERMRIDSSGNVGIGITSPTRQLHILNSSGDNRGIMVENTVATSYAEVHIKAAREFRIGTGGSSSDSNSSDRFFIFDATAAAHRFTISSTGNVGIGTTTPDCKLDVRKSGTTAAHGDTDLFVGDSGAASSTAQVQIHGGTSGFSNLYFSDAGAYNVGGFTYNHSSNYLATNVNGAETMRITSNGDLCIGGTATQTARTASFDVETNNVVFDNCTTSGAGNGAEYQTFRRHNGTNAVQIGSIVMNGTTGVTYGTSSDYRLKEDLKDFKGLEMVSKIPVYDFKWKADGKRGYGVMAHELQEILPQAVTSEKDAEKMQEVDYSKIVPLLVKSIQELKKEIEILKSK